MADIYGDLVRPGTKVGTYTCCSVGCSNQVKGGDLAGAGMVPEPDEEYPPVQYVVCQACAESGHVIVGHGKARKQNIEI